jgi:hypothetical protein
MAVEVEELQEECTGITYQAVSWWNSKLPCPISSVWNAEELLASVSGSNNENQWREVTILLFLSRAYMRSNNKAIINGISVE